MNNFNFCIVYIYISAVQFSVQSWLTGGCYSHCGPVPRSHLKSLDRPVDSYHSTVLDPEPELGLGQDQAVPTSDELRL